MTAPQDYISHSVIDRFPSVSKMMRCHCITIFNKLSLLHL